MTSRKPFQFGLGSLFGAMLCFGAALGIGMVAYRMQNLVAPYWFLGLSYAFGGAGIGVLDRKIIAGAVCGLLVWISLPLVGILLQFLRW